ncbi:MAG: hypothetical protein M0P20_06830 [Methanocorpusculum sp.]|nr:hypothetical protein [Methanocorpusculum sp.]
MSKHIFKIMGALLFMALFVSISVGAVSADPINIYSGSVQITDDMLALTYDVPSWPSINPIGDFMPAASALGVLRETSLADSTLTYNASYNNATGAITITEINGNTAASTQKWFPFIGTTAAGNTAMTASNGQTITYLLARESGLQNYNAVYGRATKMATITVSTANPAYDITGDVTVANNATALDVLNATKTAGLITNFNYTWVEDYYTPGNYYAWLTDINGVPTYKWTETGYGYALLKDMAATDSLDQTFFTTNSTYDVFMAPSEYGGYYDGTTVGGYYLDGITECLSLNVIVSQ